MADTIIGVATPPDITVNMLATCKAGVWSFFAVPDGEYADSDRVQLGTGRVGAGMMFPIALVDQFAARQASKQDDQASQPTQAPENAPEASEVAS